MRFVRRLAGLKPKLEAARDDLEGVGGAGVGKVFLVNGEAGGTERLRIVDDAEVVEAAVRRRCTGASFL